MTSESSEILGTVPCGSRPMDCCEVLDVNVNVVEGNAPVDDLLP